MKILLINSNPVVSRLTALSARKEDIQIDEIQEVTELSNDNYDIVFVDADSWSKDVSDVISENIRTQKKVLFYAQDDKKEQGVFDVSILKPFLPSEVSAVIRSLENDVTVSEPSKSKDETHFDILESAKEDKKDDFLLNLDDDLKVEKVPLKEPVETKKELFDDLPSLENDKLDDKDFNKTLEEAFPMKKEDFDDDLFEDIKKEDSLELKKEEVLFDLDLSDDVALEKELFSTDSKNDIKIENSGLLNLDLDKSNELDLTLDFSNEKEAGLKIEKPTENASKEELPVVTTKIAKEEKKNMSEMVIEKEKKTIVETKILDEIEVANIKNILENDSSPEIELSDLMTVSTPVIVESLKEETRKNKILEVEVKEKKKKSKKPETPSVQSDALIETLSALPIDTIKGLLSGATVKINIKFPKVK
jgi:hypothetical protein